MSFELLEHPGDAKLRARGETLEDAFSGVVDAVSALVGGTGIDGPETTREVELAARNPEALLFDFLDRLILFQDLEDVVVTRATALAIEETDDGVRLSATLHGVAIPPDRTLLDVKAPTYSEMRIEENAEWVIEAVLDL
ncbi:hypothetical protein JCM30237_25030 [Halolamina litorea]|uniref:Archease n=1 Tax=Halolamina litorea TaxID=1515593 RepID=A0ABD6BUQ9_9EURY|nr:archease [Halolamina litorea]